ADRVPLLRQDDDVGAGRGGPRHEPLGLLEVGRPVGAARHLDAGDAERFGHARTIALPHGHGRHAGPRLRAFLVFRSREFRLVWSAPSARRSRCSRPCCSAAPGTIIAAGALVSTVLIACVTTRPWLRAVD